MLPGAQVALNPSVARMPPSGSWMKGTPLLPAPPQGSGSVLPSSNVVPTMERFPPEDEYRSFPPEHASLCTKERFTNEADVDSPPTTIPPPRNPERLRSNRHPAIRV